MGGFFEQTEIAIINYYHALNNEKMILRLCVFGIIISFVVSWTMPNGMFDKYNDTRIGLFILVCTCIWLGLFNSILEICKERNNVDRKFYEGLKPGAYLTSLCIVQLSICFIQSFILILINSIFVQYPGEGILFGFYAPEYFFVFWLIIFTADSMGLLVSSIVNSSTSALKITPLLLLIQLVLSGVLFKLNSSIKWMSNLTICKWGMAALGSLTNLEELKGFDSQFSLDPKGMYEHAFFHVADIHFILLIFIFINLFLTYLFLKIPSVKK